MYVLRFCILTLHRMLNYHWTLILVSFGLFKYFFLFVFHSLSIFQFSDILRICNLPFFFFLPTGVWLNRAVWIHSYLRTHSNYFKKKVVRHWSFGSCLFELEWTLLLYCGGLKANSPSRTKHWLNEKASKSGTSLQSSHLSFRSCNKQGQSWPPATICFFMACELGEGVFH